ncbi:MAG TPA: cation:dicarboxylase symporter family transporter [Blastocatellia bacterium]|nr:cation:dicarboxylase symporter family transporter [Blastocatellia bacterium]
MRLPKISLTWKIMIGLVLGIALGALQPEWGQSVRPLSILFLNLIKSIIAPLIFSTLVIGIAGTGDIKQVGRIGFKSLVYFEIVTTFALFIGLAAVNITKPGVGVDMSSAVAKKEDNKATLADRANKSAAEANESAQRAAEYAAQAQSGVNPNAANQAVSEAVNAAQKSSDAAQAAAKGLTAPDPPAKPQTFGDIIAHLSPTSIIKAMADGDVLQIVIFSVLFALAVTSIGSKADAVVRWCESLADIMFRFTEFVMKFAPIGVGAAMANTVGHSGLGVLKNLGMLVGTLYGSLIFFLLFVLGPVAYLFRVPVKDFFRAVREPATIAFATTSSESALPRAMENMQRLGVPRRIVGFVLPTGYSFNLDGTTLYLSLASIFVAQAAGVHLTFWQQLTMLLTLMLTSKGVAGVPRASLVILLGTLNSFNLPAEGVIIILGVDELMDMARTAVNVIGNCLATVVIAQWEKAFRNEEWKAEERELEEVTGQEALVTT